LLHELAHIARRDCLTQLRASVVAALYWPHPGAWWLARRLRIERELKEPKDRVQMVRDVLRSLGKPRAEEAANA
jgi:beta-lactamase regulating signal transducer with metallopeptidase domain